MNMRVVGMKLFRKTSKKQNNILVCCLSFSLWKDVTYCLKFKQLDRATTAKSFLERRQRNEAKERAEKSLKWQTKVMKTKEKSI